MGQRGRPARVGSVSRWLSSFLIGLSIASGACEQKPLGEPWCDCTAKLGSTPVMLRVYPQPKEGWGAFSPQQIKVTVARDDQPQTLELDMMLKNEGTNLGPHNVRLLLVAPDRYQLRFEGEEQDPACYRLVEPGKLRLESCAPGTEVDCLYRPLRQDQ